MPDPVLELRGVIKEFGDAVVTRVLHGIDLRLEQGEFAALIGPSGSGKSTLLNLVGLLDRPTAGQVWVHGERTDQLDDDELTRLRARSLGFVFQFHHLVGALSAVENVMMALAADQPRLTREMRQRSVAALAEVGLADRADEDPRRLSGGQQQRVAIARALVRRPPLILADEPTGNLDTRSADDVFTLMRRFNHETGIAFLIVTHDPRIASRCDRTIELIDGRIAPRPT
ncbi:MAG: ABC transporter ATP-binding protein [Myxococcales bacterium]|nr:ABC transporter ATP-binding protein [Myxococcales bacterium]